MGCAGRCDTVGNVPSNDGTAPGRRVTGLELAEHRRDWHRDGQWWSNAPGNNGDEARGSEKRTWGESHSMVRHGPGDG